MSPVRNWAEGPGPPKVDLIARDKDQKSPEAPRSGGQSFALHLDSRCCASSNEKVIVGGHDVSGCVPVSTSGRVFETEQQRHMKTDGPETGHQGKTFSEAIGLVALPRRLSSRKGMAATTRIATKTLRRWTFKSEVSLRRGGAFHVNSDAPSTLISTTDLCEDDRGSRPQWIIETTSRTTKVRSKKRAGEP
jgi:hypothetical protein